MFWELFFEHLRAAQRVSRVVFECFRAAQRVLELAFENFRAAQRVLDEFWMGLGSVPPWGSAEGLEGLRGY